MIPYQHLLHLLLLLDQRNDKCDRNRKVFFIFKFELNSIDFLLSARSFIRQMGNAKKFARHFFGLCLGLTSRKSGLNSNWIEVKTGLYLFGNVCLFVQPSQCGFLIANIRRICTEPHPSWKVSRFYCQTTELVTQIMWIWWRLQFYLSVAKGSITIQVSFLRTMQFVDYWIDGIQSTSRSTNGLHFRRFGIVTKKLFHFDECPNRRASDFRALKWK